MTTTTGLDQDQRLEIGGGGGGACLTSAASKQFVQPRHLDPRHTNGHHQVTATATSPIIQPPQVTATANATSVSLHCQDKNFDNQQQQQQQEQQMQPQPQDDKAKQYAPVNFKAIGDASTWDNLDPARDRQRQGTTCQRVTQASSQATGSYNTDELDENSSSSEELLAVASAEEYAAKILKLQQACLIPLKEDLADWLNKILKTSNITTENFMDKLDNGVVICRLAKIISSWCEQQLSTSATLEATPISTSTTNIHPTESARFADLDDYGVSSPSPRSRTNLFTNANGPLRSTTSQSINCLTTSQSSTSLNNGIGSYRTSAGNQFLNNLIKMHQTKIWEDAKCRTFYARDNVCNFIKWTKDIGVNRSVLFESDDLVLHANPRQVVLCLLDVARIAYVKYGFTEAPGLVKFEQEIDKEMHATGQNLGSEQSLSSDILHKSHKSSDKQPHDPSVAGRRFSGCAKNSLGVPIDATDELVMRYCRHKEEEARKRNEESAVAAAEAERQEALERARYESATVTTTADNYGQSTPGLDDELPMDTTSLEDQSSVIERSIPLALHDMANNDSLMPEESRESEVDCSAHDDHFADVSSTTCDLKPNHTKNLADTGRIDSLDSGEGPTESASTGHSGGRLTTDISNGKLPYNSNNTSIPVPKTRTNLSQYNQRTESSMTNSELSSSRSSLLSNQDGNNLNSNYERQATSDLDGKVMRIAKSYYGKKATKDVTRLSEGKYKIADRIVFVRLLKGHRVMVRIGGGWDTLENFLFRHKSDPSQVIDPDNLLPLETKMPFEKTPQATPTKSTSKLPYYRRSNSASSTNLSLSNLSISNHSLISSTTPSTKQGRTVATSSSVQSSPIAERSRQQIPFLLINKGRQASTNTRLAYQASDSPLDQATNRPSQASSNNSPSVSHLRRPFYYQKTAAPFSTSKHSPQRALASSTASAVSATNLNLFPATLTTRINLGATKSSGSTKFLTNINQGKVSLNKNETMRKFGLSNDSLPTSSRKSPLHRGTKQNSPTAALN